MSDNFEELGHEPTLPNDPDRFTTLRQKCELLESLLMKARTWRIRYLKKDEPELECAVCKQTGTKDEMFRILPCKHEFHDECILLWLNVKRNCPMCRYVIYRLPAP